MKTEIPTRRQIHDEGKNRTIKIITEGVAYLHDKLFQISEETGLQLRESSQVKLKKPITKKWIVLYEAKKEGDKKVKEGTLKQCLDFILEQYYGERFFSKKTLKKPFTHL